MSAKVIVSLCIVAFAAGCASFRRAPRDQASDPKTELNIQAEHRRFVSLMAQSVADSKIKELKPQLDLTAEQESAIRKAYIQQNEQLMTNLVAFFIPLPPEAYHLQSERDLLKPLLTPKQLAAYDAFKVRQRKERVLETAEESVDRLVSPLDLTDQQRNEVCEIFAIFAEQQLEAADKNHFASVSDQENEMLRDVLTSSQFEHYQKLCQSERRKYQTTRTTFLVPPLLFPVSAPSMPAGGFHMHR